MLVSASGVLLPCPSLWKFRQYCGWAEWEAWGSCSSTCGQGSVHRHTGGGWTAVDGCGRLWTAEATNLGLPLRSSCHWFLHVTDIHRQSWLIFICYINIYICVYYTYTHMSQWGIDRAQFMLQGRPQDASTGRLEFQRVF